MWAAKATDVKGMLEDTPREGRPQRPGRAGEEGRGEDSRGERRGEGGGGREEGPSALPTGTTRTLPPWPPAKSKVHGGLTWSPSRPYLKVGWPCWTSRTPARPAGSWGDGTGFPGHWTARPQDGRRGPIICPSPQVWHLRLSYSSCSDPAPPLEGPLGDLPSRQSPLPTGLLLLLLPGSLLPVPTAAGGMLADPPQSWSLPCRALQRLPQHLG